MAVRIHPAIGVARVGNSSLHFVGPDVPGIPANWDAENLRFLKFKDSEGKILKQAAHFRLFEFDESGASRELTAETGLQIEWRVHVANRKASFFTFNGQSGAETNPPYVGRQGRTRIDVEKKEGGRGRPGRKNFRNPRIEDRRSLEIDPGEVSLNTPGSKDLIDGSTGSPIKSLGRVEMRPDGSLLFVPADGNAECSSGTDPIDEYANNDGWFDDMCDGVVQASVIFPDGRRVEAESAWVIVGPPDFAPGIGNVVSLYDLLWDLSVRHKLRVPEGSDAELADLAEQQRVWSEESKVFAAEYRPSFTTHIYPILSRALAARDVHEPPPQRQHYHHKLADWERLSKIAEVNIRQSVFKRFRSPHSDQVNWKDMPRGLGDEFTTLDDFEEGSGIPPSARAFLSLTSVQYALLSAWFEGRFIEDWPHGDVRFAPVAASPNGTPHDLDRAALENCVGGPFYPGIEVSWLIRYPELYLRAFRLRAPGFTFGPLPFGPGFFSQQMALPWQADFYDCHKEDHTPEGADEPLVYMWWTAQRPDDVRTSPDGPYRRWVKEFDSAQDEEAEGDADDIRNLARFEQMRTRWHELSFVVLDGDQHLEQK
jgi:hypothetical protein